ncbi:MAG: hypothetical protein LBK50_02765 [Candidatus Nomurabacteria bacterium]|jgi:hypothetical protein|nr:hypothetical protein [Candidatus Nomurabacteria bacterium]
MSKGARKRAKEQEAKKRASSRNAQRHQLYARQKGRKKHEGMRGPNSPFYEEEVDE